MFYLDLIEDWTWVARRVETIEIQDSRHRVRRVSLDIDTRELASRIQKHKLSDLQEVPLPVAVFQKGLLLDFDLRDGDGHALSSFTSREQSLLARLAIAAKVRAPNSKVSKISNAQLHAVADLGYEISNEFVDVDDITDWYIHDNKILPRCVLTGGADAKAAWNIIESDETLFDFVEQYFLASYIPTLWYPVTDGPEILKYRRLEGEQDTLLEHIGDVAGRRETYSAVPQDSWVLSLRVSDVRSAVREHIRVLAPGGTFLSSGLMQYWHPTKPIPEYSYWNRRSPQRDIYYHPGSPGQQPRIRYVHAVLTPDPERVMAPILLWTWAITLLLALGALAQLSPLAFLTHIQEHLDPAMSLLLIVPSLSLAYVVRMDDEPIRRALLAPSRSWAVFCIVPLVLAAGALLFDYHQDQYLLGLIWLLCAALTGLSLRRNSSVAWTLGRLLRGKELESESTVRMTWSHQPIDLNAAQRGLTLRRVGNGALTTTRLIVLWAARAVITFVAVGLALLFLAYVWVQLSEEAFRFFGLVYIAPGASFEQFAQEATRIGTRTTSDDVGRLVTASGRGLLTVALGAVIATAPIRIHPARG
ncbi:hypothetical protein [Agromyces allii]|uniref:Membrane protein DUF2207 n=1 Tax=Agromyces allii TaxID=393607 RepID=A0ABN2QMB4_9MICO|nr:hypothetical protein [Agromyces allii]